MIFLSPINPEGSLRQAVPVWTNERIKHTPYCQLEAKWADKAYLLQGMKEQSLLVFVQGHETGPGKKRNTKSFS